MDYVAIKAEIAKPAYAGKTDAQIAATLQAMTVQTATQGAALFAPSQILNAFDPVDFAGLVDLQLSQLRVLLSGGAVDISKGSNIRAMFQDIFATSKGATLNNLAALVAVADQPLTIPFARSPSETIDAGAIAFSRSGK